MKSSQMVPRFTFKPIQYWSIVHCTSTKIDNIKHEIQTALVPMCKKAAQNLRYCGKMIFLWKTTNFRVIFFPFEKKSINDSRIDSTVELNSSGSDGNKSEIAVSSLDLKGNLCLGGTSSSPLSFCSSPYPWLIFWPKQRTLWGPPTDALFLKFGGIKSFLNEHCFLRIFIFTKY